MFIRWKRRKKKQFGKYGGRRYRSDRGDSLYCVLVESQRINGAPRQKVISYLGSVDEGDRERLCVRVDFWDEVLAKLDQQQLDPAARSKIEESIGLIVSRAPEDEVEAFKKERDAFIEKSVEVFRRLGRMR